MPVGARWPFDAIVARLNMFEALHSAAAGAIETKVHRH